MVEWLIVARGSRVQTPLLVAYHLSLQLQGEMWGELQCLIIPCLQERK